MIVYIPDTGGSDNDGSASDGNWRPSEIVTAQASTRPKERKREGPSAKKPRGSMASSTGGTTKGGGRALGAGGKAGARKRRARGGGSSSSDEGGGEVFKSALVDDGRARQCHGQKCVNSCRPGSNYCSGRVTYSFAYILLTFNNQELLLFYWLLQEKPVDKRVM